MTLKLSSNPPANPLRNRSSFSTNQSTPWEDKTRVYLEDVTL